MDPSIQLQRAPLLTDPRWLHAQTTCAYRCIDLKRCYMYARRSQPVYTHKHLDTIALYLEAYDTPYDRSWLKQNAASNSSLMVQWGAKVSLTTGFLSNSKTFFGSITKSHNILNLFVNIFQKCI